VPLLLFVLKSRCLTELKSRQDFSVANQPIMKHLLNHTRSMTGQQCLDLLNVCRKSLINIDAHQLSQPPAVTLAVTESDLDRQIIETLEKLLPSAAASYKQGASDLKQAQRYSWRGPATDFRESLRETLDHLAPDLEVKKMDNPKNRSCG
jgi:hypothetical protein